MEQSEQVFAERFTEVWKRPTPERLVELLHPDVVLYESEWPPIKGVRAAFEEFSNLLTWLPDLHGEVKRHLGGNGLLFIEWTLVFPIGQPFPVNVVDRFFVEGGLGTERVTFFDEQPLMTAIMASPTYWAGYLRYRSARMALSEKHPEPSPQQG